jgi:hypothetical protein
LFVEPHLIWNEKNTVNQRSSAAKDRKSGNIGNRRINSRKRNQNINKVDKKERKNN